MINITTKQQKEHNNVYEAIPENIIFKSQNRKSNQDVKNSMLVGREFMEAVPLKMKFNHG